jgi:hypothetical protein
VADLHPLQLMQTPPSTSVATFSEATLKSIVLALLAMATAASAANAADYPAATTTANATVRVAPSAEAKASGATIPAGTHLAVEICFNEGEYCLVSGDGVPGGSFIAGDLITQDGQGGLTIRAIEQAKWKSIHEAEANRSTSTDLDQKNIVVWGDSLSTDTFGDELQNLLIGREVSMQGKPGEDGAQIAARMLADISFDKRIKVIWDRHWDGETVDRYMSELAPMIDKAAATGTPYVIISDVPDLDGTDKSSAQDDASQTAAINQALQAKYPDNYLDMVAPLADPSLHKDGLHLNKAGEAAVAKAIADFVTSKGW